LFTRSIALDVRMADNRTIFPSSKPRVILDRCECCKGTVWVPFKMLRERMPMLSAMTLDQLGAKMKCDNAVSGPSYTTTCKPERHTRVWFEACPGPRVNFEHSGSKRERFTGWEYGIVSYSRTYLASARLVELG